MEEKINLMEYTYSPDQVVTIDVKGYQIYNLIELLNLVVADNRVDDVFLDVYPQLVNPNFTEDKNLDTVDIEWAGYPNANSFFSQRPVSGMTTLGAHALDLVNVFKNVHKALVEDGTAKKQTEDL